MKPNQANKPPSIHPKAQVIITGKSLTPEQAQEVIQFSKGMSVDSWCGVDGSIGHIDSLKPNTTYDKLYSDLLELTNKFYFLDLGISVMSGPPGTFTMPVVSFQLKECSLKRNGTPHYGHPAPKRLKKIEV